VIEIEKKTLKDAILPSVTPDMCYQYILDNTVYKQYSIKDQEMQTYSAI